MAITDIQQVERQAKHNANQHRAVPIKQPDEPVLTRTYDHFAMVFFMILLAQVTPADTPEAM